MNTDTSSAGATADRIAEGLDAALIDALSRGQPLVGPDGNAVLDEQGRPVFATPSAALLSVALKREKALRLQKALTDPNPVAVAVALQMCRERANQRKENDATES